MPDRLDQFPPFQKPTPDRPLQGQTILAVEDSRFASEALRLLCLRSGARVRRADSLASAARHLATYRPTVALVDPGLPDGSGTALIADLKGGAPPVPLVLAISGDADREAAAIAAGADGFLLKPLSSLAAFQHEILSRLPLNQQPPGPRRVPSEVIEPDRLALDEDLAEIAQHLADTPPPERVAYLAQFLVGLARSAGDRALEEAAEALAASRAAPALASVRNALEARLAQRAVI